MHDLTRASAEPTMPPLAELRAMRAKLLAWYDANARVLPWRVGPSDTAVGVRQDAYRVWLSEIMLQQTTVATVTPRFDAFLAAAPTVEALAALPVETVMELWAGLGYYARARNLHACAKAVVARGGFPETLDGLKALPGIGNYTARAVGSIAFDLPVTPVDGNVERVVSRLVRVEQSLPGAKPLFEKLASAFDSADRPGDFAQALMDLGSTVCMPKGPRCHQCPWFDHCAAAKAGLADQYPRKKAKSAKPMRVGAVVVITDGRSVLLRRRPEQGLLGGMLEVPGSAWVQVETLPREAYRGDSKPAAIHMGQVRHVFTHFTLYLDVWRLDVADFSSLEGLVTPISALDGAALPTIMRKALEVGLSQNHLL